MRLSKPCAVTVILCSMGLAACGAKTDTTPEIFNQISQSDFFTNSATEIKCEDSADYLTSQYQRLCFQFNTITIQSVEEAGETGLNLGFQTQAVLRDSDWEARLDDPTRFHYIRPDKNGCTNKLFFVFDEVENFKSNDGDYPLEYAPLLNFSKLRQPVCEKI